MPEYLVCLSDTRADLVSGTHETTADIWCYRIEAGDAAAAVAPAIERWTADAGERTPASLSVSRLTPAG